MEKDDEVKGGGNSYTTEFRQYDARVGRWLTIDPLASNAPGWTPYRAFFNNPLIFIDPDGLYETKKDAKKAKKNAEKAGWQTGDVKSFKDENGNKKYYFQGTHKNHDGVVGYRNKTDFSEESFDLARIFWGLGHSVTTTDIIASIISHSTEDMKSNELWGKSKKLQKKLKNFSKNKWSSTNKVHTKLTKPALKLVNSNLVKALPAVGAVFIISDAAMSKEVKPSHILDATILGIGTIPVYGWVIGGVYVISDITTYAITGKSIGDHLNEVEFSTIIPKTNKLINDCIYEINEPTNWGYFNINF